MQFNDTLKTITMFLIVISINTYAHQPNLASFILSKTENGKNIVQLTGALTGFEGEINYNFGKNSFKTPEEFRQLVIRRFKETTSFFINEKQVTFKNPIVILGHETKLVTEVIGLPKNAKEIKLTSTFFENTSQNQIATLFILDNYPQEKYVLSNKNKHTINLIYENEKWIENKSKYNNFIHLIIVISVFILVSTGVYLKNYKKNI